VKINRVVYYSITARVVKYSRQPWTRCMLWGQAAEVFDGWMRREPTGASWAPNEVWGWAPADMRFGAVQPQHMATGVSISVN